MAKWTIAIPDDIAAKWEPVTGRFEIVPAGRTMLVSTDGRLVVGPSVGASFSIEVKPKVRTWGLNGHTVVRTDGATAGTLYDDDASELLAILNAGQRVIDEKAKP